MAAVLIGHTWLFSALAELPPPLEELETEHRHKGAPPEGGEGKKKLFAWRRFTG